MEFEATTTPASQQRSHCLLVAAFEDRRLSAAARGLDEASGGRLGKLLKTTAFTGKPGQTECFNDLPGVSAERILVAGFGAQSGLDETRFRKGLDGAARTLATSGARDAALYLDEVEVAGRDRYWKGREMVTGVRAAAYRFEAMKSKKSAEPVALRRLALEAPGRSEARALALAITHGQAIADGSDLARDLGNLPGNVCTPSYLGDRARELARRHPSLKATVRGEPEIRRLKMGAFLAVARGSREPPRLITLEYSGGRRGQRPVVLVGKGVTFDSGGISIKPSQAMDEMKYDMCGAAGVLGTLAAVAAIGLPINVVAIVPATENLPDGLAIKPGDIVTTLSGQTVEILNTDAEGRLILCDALSHAARYKPAAVIDAATLTGACVVALGNHASGLFSTDEALAAELLEAGSFSGDRAWRMPLWEEYGEGLSSNFADMANVGGREAGAITAASFLSRFTRDYPWAHLDIAGTAWTSGKAKGATGRPVPLLTQLLIARADALPGG